jgi:hypothetical protein
MKTLKIISSLLLVFAMFAFTSANDKVPKKVTDAFAKKFPTLKK